MSKKDLPIDLMMKSVEWKAVDGCLVDIDDEMPVTTHEGVLHFEGITIRCYKLNNGQSVFDADDIESFFKLN